MTYPFINPMTPSSWSTGPIIPPTKKDIIQRLFNAGHISFDEMWTLIRDDSEATYQYIPPYVPDVPQWGPGYTPAPIVNPPLTSIS